MNNTKNTEIIIQHNSPNKQGPDYSLRIDGNGNVEYNGLKNVNVSKISPEDFNRILHEFQDLYFFSFKDSYESINQSKSQQEEQISVSLRLGDKYKTVKYTEGSRVEPGLKMLVKQIENITNPNAIDK